MSVRIRLFGRFAIEREDVALERFCAGKAQELLCYLLVHRDRRHSREQLATALWGDTTTARSRKHLRHVLWHLQRQLRHVGEPADRAMIAVDGDSVQFTANPTVWVDVAAFEDAIAATRGIERLNDDDARRLENAVAFYRGDLLDGCYADWCRDERERLLTQYLAALDALTAHHEMRGDYAAALRSGALSLRRDRARECTHQRLMRIHYLAGDRAAALRQFERCAAALDQELDIRPSAPTLALREQIRAGTVLAASSAVSANNDAPLILRHVLERLRSLEQDVVDLHGRLETSIRDVEDSLTARRVAPASRLPKAPERRAERRAGETRPTRVAAVGAAQT